MPDIAEVRSGPGRSRRQFNAWQALIPNLLERALLIRSTRIAATRAYGRNVSASLAVLKINRSDRILRPTPTSAATQPRGKEPSVYCSFGSVSRMLPSVRTVFMTATASSGSLLRFASVSLPPMPCSPRRRSALRSRRRKPSMGSRLEDHTCTDFRFMLRGSLTWRRQVRRAPSKALTQLVIRGAANRCLGLGPLSGRVMRANEQGYLLRA